MLRVTFSLTEQLLTIEAETTDTIASEAMVPKFIMKDPSFKIIYVPHCIY